MQLTLGHYRLIRPLPQPASRLFFARPQLYLAQSAHHRAMLVIKMLSSMAGSIAQQQFQQEIRVLTQLNQHPSDYWLPLYDYGQDSLSAEPSSLKSEQVNYLVFPYIEQGNIRQALDHSSPNLRQTGQWWLAMLEAVTALHQQGWLHLDIKPSNFLLNASSVYLIDFALAQPSPNLHPDMPAGVLATTQGTPRYMSPEQFLGQPLNEQADFYSLGLILYEMLTGKSVFTAASYQGWATQHCQHPVPLLPPSLAGFQILIDGLLAKNRQNRLAGADVIYLLAKQAFAQNSHLF